MGGGAKHRARTAGDDGLRCVVQAQGWIAVGARAARADGGVFEFVESCGDGTPTSVAHVVVPTYALEHKIFAKDALKRWRNAKLYTAPGQFTFPIRDLSDEIVFGRRVDGVLEGSDVDARDVPWRDEIEYETLRVGAFDVGSTSQTIYETAFFHKSTKTLIVTDALAQIPIDPPEANSVDKLLVVSQRSTADPVPEDTPEARRVGWEKTALLVNYFFPEHEELDPSAPRNGDLDGRLARQFQALAGRLLVPPVVRTLLYAQDPAAVRRWVAAVRARWDFERIVPAHWQAPLPCTPDDFERAFAFLDDDAIDAFPPGDLARGLAPVAGRRPPRVDARLAREKEQTNLRAARRSVHDPPSTLPFSFRSIHIVQ